MTIGNRIIQARKKKGLTQEYLAEQLQVSRQAVSKWETGQSSPDTKNLIALSQLLGVSVEYLATGNQAAQEPPAPKPDHRLEEILSNTGFGLFLLAILMYLIGFLTGIFNEMVIIRTENFGIGIPFLLYGDSPAAIVLLVFEGIFLIGAVTLWTISYRLGKKT